MLKYSLLNGDCLEKLKIIPDNFCRCCVTSPPYWSLRNYISEGQIGQESSPKEYINKLADVFDEVYRILTDDGTFWLNIGDTYCGTGHKNNLLDPKYEGRNGQSFAQNNKIDGIKQKETVGIPWMLAFALRDRGWYLRQDIIWAKKNCLPESVSDRCTRSHEYIFLLTKNKKYYYDNKAIFEEAAYDGRKDTKLKKSQKYADGKYLVNQSEQTFHAKGHERWPNQVDGVPMKNKRSVWNMGTASYKGGHYAVMPFELAETCVKAGTQEGDWVLDPFSGVATTGMAALAHKRNYVGVELNLDFLKESQNRIENSHGMFVEEIEIGK